MTRRYTQEPWAHVMSVQEFRLSVEQGLLTDYDGYGSPMRDGLVDPHVVISPSEVHRIPADATHIEWYNR